MTWPRDERFYVLAGVRQNLHLMMVRDRIINAVSKRKGSLAALGRIAGSEYPFGVLETYDRG